MILRRHVFSRKSMIVVEVRLYHKTNISKILESNDSAQYDDPVNTFTICGIFLMFILHSFIVLLLSNLCLPWKQFNFQSLVFTNTISSAYFSYLVNGKIQWFVSAFTFLLCVHSGVNVTTIASSDSISTGSFELGIKTGLFGWRVVVNAETHEQSRVCLDCMTLTINMNYINRMDKHT